MLPAGRRLMRHDTARLSLILLMAPFLLWIGLLVVLPQLGIGYLSLREKIGPRQYEFGFGNYMAFFGEPTYWNTLLRTAWMSILVTALALLIGFPVAYYIAKIARRHARAGPFLLCLIPLWVSDLVRAFGWIILLRETGLISGALQWAGLVSGPVELLYNEVTVISGTAWPARPASSAWAASSSAPPPPIPNCSKSACADCAPPPGKS